MTFPSGQALAYMGDAVYELELRAQCIQAGITRVQQLHDIVSELTSGQAQAWAFSLLEGEWTDEELSWFKQGRNAPLSKKSRKVSTQEAHTSSGFEAIFGGLFWTKNSARITSLCAQILSTKNPALFSK